MLLGRLVGVAGYRILKFSRDAQRSGLGFSLSPNELVDEKNCGALEGAVVSGERVGARDLTAPLLQLRPIQEGDLDGHEKTTWQMFGKKCCSPVQCYSIASLQTCNFRLRSCENGYSGLSTHSDASSDTCERGHDHNSFISFRYPKILNHS